ncbi:putative Transcription factor domain-containing protein [Seiridium unicorne]|uniref:Transcription factor domain-containing protein n=1 Tax=Seiridium unicorne TaxID=138068 RepID=A0ABR2VH27_9PEZI
MRKPLSPPPHQYRSSECDRHPNLSSMFTPKRFLQLVETRLADLENDVRALKRQNGGGLQHNLTAVDASPSYATANGLIVRDELDETGVSPDATDGVGTIEFTDEKDSAYFGRSSNIAFMRNIRRALGCVLKTRRDPSSLARITSRLSPQVTLQVSRPESPRSRYQERSTSRHSDQGSLGLPPTAETKALVKEFFASTGVLFPYIHQASFLKTFEQVSSSNFRTLRRSWLGLLYIILAMATMTGSNLCADSTERAARAEVFFSRSEKLSIGLLMSGPTVETVQTMLLMSLYLQGTNRSVKTWNIHGLAVKAAFQLGLHSNDSSRVLSGVELETRNRTWFGCVLLDRTLSMTFGRPPAIPALNNVRSMSDELANPTCRIDNYVRTSLPNIRGYSDHGYIAQENPEVLSSMFFNETIKLYKIMWTVIDTLYACNVDSQTEDSIHTVASNILRIEQQFLEWESSLNPALALIQAQELSFNTTYTLARRLRVILTLRFHNLCILAYRPYLDFCLNKLGGQPVTNSGTSIFIQIGGRNVQTCFQSASTIIGIVHSITHSAGPSLKLLGAWWFTLYYTFNATLTIAAIMLMDRAHGRVDHSEPDIPGATLRASLIEGIECLPLIDPGNPAVSKCTQVASTISRYLDLLSRQTTLFLASISSSNIDDETMETATASVETTNVDQAHVSESGSLGYFPADLSHIGPDWDLESSGPIFFSDTMDEIRDTDLFY